MSKPQSRTDNPRSSIGHIPVLISKPGMGIPEVVAWNVESQATRHSMNELAVAGSTLVAAGADDAEMASRFWPRVVGGTVITAQAAAWLAPTIRERWAERVDEAMEQGGKRGKLSRWFGKVTETVFGEK